uniref:Potassium channel toxin alpha-KTx 12.7 n=1 Tax=Lychas mucronatus TaxID=172552 RepID=KA127_LYCMC|nr:RecName: Full=Potassium channel toxin alpha-KTx 12.7; Flags: Precursor [Lychas mucronatus]
MSNMPVLIITLLLFSMYISTAAQKPTEIKCRYPADCHIMCRKVTGRAEGKCMNGKCTCYY